MAAKTLRKIIQIDEDKCNGCGNCIQACAEGALALVGGKARLVSEKYCDGLAACLGECPQDAIRIIEREAQDFDEESAKEHLKQTAVAAGNTACHCPGSAVRDIARPGNPSLESPLAEQESTLSHWPVQLTLVPPGAAFLKGKDVVLIADCVPFAYPNMHRDFLKDHSVLVACPKLDDFAAHQEKLEAILQTSAIKSLTVVHMEVPCCSGLAYMARQAIAASGLKVFFKEVTIGIHGDIKAAAASPVR
jgi:Pyruvate/2-oxoacid:ferredoxin oxidoreductase delta subunit